MEKNELENLINGIGSMAELTAMFFKSLVAEGVDVGSAAHISGEFIKGILSMAKGE